MSQADQIREHVIKNYINPARASSRRYVIIRSGDVHNEMKLAANHPNVCQAIDGHIFKQEANVRLVERAGPHASSTVEWVFAIQ